MMVMMLSRSLRVAIAPELFIAGDLIRVEQGAGFEMRRQMHGAQAALQLGNGRRRGGEAIRRDFALGKELVEYLFLRTSKRIVSARIVMPIIGAVELRDLLTQLIDALTEQGVIIPEAPFPTLITPPRRPH
jgi:hypothetical protein